MKPEENLRPEVSDLLLDRYRLGELKGDQADIVRDALKQDAALREKLASFERNAQRFEQEMDLPLLSAETLRQANALEQDSWLKRIRNAARSHGMAVRLASGLATIAAFALIITTFTENPWRQSGQQGGTYRIKGDPVLLNVVVKRGSAQQVLKNGDEALEADQLRFTIKSTQRGWAYLVVVDTEERTSLFSPPGDFKPTEVLAGSEYVFPGALELDDALGTEFAVALVCAAEQARQEVLKLAHEAAKRNIPAKHICHFAVAEWKKSR